MSTGRKVYGSGNAARVDAAKKWVAEETRAEAKEVFAQHTRETSNLDVLSRCKKLNELLSSDVLKGKGDAKAQLKEILGILHAGPKRPAFLDKPPVTAIAGKRGTSSSGATERLVTPPTDDSVITDNTGTAESITAVDKPSARPAAGTLQQPSAEEEDIITLLNGPLPVHDSQVALLRRTPQDALIAAQETNTTLQQQAAADEAAETQRLRAVEARAEAEQRERIAKEAEREVAERECKAREAAEAAEHELKAKEAAEVAERERRVKEAEEAAERERRAKEAAERERRAKEAAERERKVKEAEEAAERKRAEAEALRLQRVQFGAALCMQSHWRGYCGRRQAALRRQELAEQHAAASLLQAAWRSRQAALEYRQRLVAAGTLQCAVRAWCGRRHLQELRVEAFRQRRAARIIQRAFLAYRARGYTLGPLRLPPGPRPQSSLGVDGAALLAKQLRLRSAMDARLAPECVFSSSGGADDDSARNHRTVVTHMERVRQVSATERHRRCDVSERAIMVASEHRDTAEALAIARQGFGTCTPRAPSPSLAWRPVADCARPESRRTSGSRSGSDAGGLVLAGSTNGDSPALLLGSRPSTGLRRTQGSWGG